MIVSITIPNLMRRGYIVSDRVISGVNQSGQDKTRDIYRGPPVNHCGQTAGEGERGGGWGEGGGEEGVGGTCFICQNKMFK